MDTKTLVTSVAILSLLLSLGLSFLGVPHAIECKVAQIGANVAQAFVRE